MVVKPFPPYRLGDQEPELTEPLDWGLALESEVRAEVVVLMFPGSELRLELLSLEGTPMAPQVSGSQVNG